MATFVTTKSVLTSYLGYFKPSILRQSSRSIKLVQYLCIVNFRIANPIFLFLKNETLASIELSLVCRLSTQIGHF